VAQQEEEEEECLTLISVSPGQDTIIPITETPGLHSHSSLAAAILLLLSSRPVLEDQTTSGEFMPLREWTLTSRNSLGALATKKMGGQFGRPSNFGNYGGVPSKQAKVQDATIEKEIPVSLEEIAKGAEKKMKISRKVHHEDGRVTIEDKVLKITVKPGWKSGTKVTFSQEGDKFPGRTPADIAFIILDKPHPVFSRDGTNLKYTYKIPLREALCGSVVQVPTLEGKKVGINCNEVIKPTTTKRLQGYGLPFPKEPNRRGDLIVSFDVLFPDTVSTTSKRTLYEALS